MKAMSARYRQGTPSPCNGAVVAWPTNHQRDMGGGIDHRPLAHAIVVAKQFAVVRREQDHRIVVHAFLLKFGDDAADLIIDEGDARIVVVL